MILTIPVWTVFLGSLIFALGVAAFVGLSILLTSLADNFLGEIGFWIMAIIMCAVMGTVMFYLAEWVS